MGKRKRTDGEGGDREPDAGRSSSSAVQKEDDQPEEEFWCYYCGKESENEQALKLHQRSKHFTCAICIETKKFKHLSESLFGLKKHVRNVHGITLEKVPNAIEGREDVEVEVIGMNGMPRNCVRVNPATGRLGAPTQTYGSHGSLDDDDWKEVSHNGKKYFYNKVTNDVSWTRPSPGERADKKASAAATWG